MKSLSMNAMQEVSGGVIGGLGLRYELQPPSNMDVFNADGISTLQNNYLNPESISNLPF